MSQHPVDVFKSAFRARAMRRTTPESSDGRRYLGRRVRHATSRRIGIVVAIDETDHVDVSEGIAVRGEIVWDDGSSDEHGFSEGEFEILDDLDGKVLEPVVGVAKEYTRRLQHQVAILRAAFGAAAAFEGTRLGELLAEDVPDAVDGAVACLRSLASRPVGSGAIAVNTCVGDLTRAIARGDRMLGRIEGTLSAVAAVAREAALSRGEDRECRMLLDLRGPAGGLEKLVEAAARLVGTCHALDDVLESTPESLPSTVLILVKDAPRLASRDDLCREMIERCLSPNRELLEQSSVALEGIVADCREVLSLTPNFAKLEEVHGRLCRYHERGLVVDPTIGEQLAELASLRVRLGKGLPTCRGLLPVHELAKRCDEGCGKVRDVVVRAQEDRQTFVKWFVTTHIDEQMTLITLSSRWLQLEALQEAFATLVKEAGQELKDNTKWVKLRDVLLGIRPGSLGTSSPRQALEAMLALLREWRETFRLCQEGIKWKEPGAKKVIPIDEKKGEKKVVAYTFVLAPSAITDWGAYDEVMKGLIDEIAAGRLYLDQHLVPFFNNRIGRSHTAGYGRIKVYLDVPDAGSGTTIRGYFAYTIQGTVVTMTPIAVTDEHGKGKGVEVLKGKL